jgi:uncharacterized protein YndB with AHSA1/START domain
MHAPSPRAAGSVPRSARYARGVLYVRVETVVRRRPEIVWDFLTDVASLPAWVEGLVEASVAGEVPRGAGMRVDLTRHARGRRYDVTCEVTGWREPSLLALETRLANLLLLDSATLEPAPEGTLLVVSGELFFGSPLVELFARPRGLLGGDENEHEAQGIYERSVRSLVKRIESLSAVPYR